MDVLVLIDKLDDIIHNARSVPLTDSVMIDREEIYDILDQMRSTIPEEIKQARWIVKERQEMLAEAKQEAERVLAEAQERADRHRLRDRGRAPRRAQRPADHGGRARARARDRLGAEDYADEVLGNLEVNLDKFIAAVRRGRERLQGARPATTCSPEPPAARSTATGLAVRRFDLRSLRFGDASEVWRRLPVEVDPFVFGGLEYEVPGGCVDLLLTAARVGDNLTLSAEFETAVTARASAASATPT